MFDKKFLDELESREREWRKANEDEFKVERKKDFTAECGIPIKRLYTPLDLKEKGHNYLDALGFPGDYPYTRGISPNMYRKGLYTIGQYSGHPTPDGTNTLWRHLVTEGATGLHVAFDIPSNSGYDADHPLAANDVGRTGVSASSLRDVETMFDGIDLSKVFVAWIAPPTATIWLAMLLAVAEKQAVPPHQLSGMQQNDVLKGFTTDGHFIFDPEHSLRLSTDVLSYCCQHIPRYLAYEVCMYHLHESGADDIQEVAFGLATAMTFVRAGLKRGLDIDNIAPRIGFIGPCPEHRDLLVKIAKVRAFRRMWCRILKEEFGAKNPASFRVWMRFGGQGGAEIALNQPELNAARIVIGGLVGVLAGTQSYSLKTAHEPVGIPSTRANAVAVKIAQIIGDETGLADTTDPMAGSYCIESLTDEVEERANKYLEKIESMGGMLKAIETGFVTREMAESARKIQKRMESGERKLYELPVEEEEKRDFCIPEPKLLETRTAALKKLRAERDNRQVEEALDNIRRAAEKKESNENNMVFPIIDAVKVYATVGEIVSALKNVWGEYRKPTFL